MPASTGTHWSDSKWYADVEGRMCIAAVLCRHPESHPCYTAMVCTDTASEKACYLIANPAPIWKRPRPYACPRSFCGTVSRNSRQQSQAALPQ